MIKNIFTDRKKIKKATMILFIFLSFFLILSTVAISSSASHEGEEAGPKGWVKTDTFRVMNFAVLAIGLFFLLKKPLSEGLESRIKRIREEIDNLEKKKLEAEEELMVYKSKFDNLYKEENNIIDDYIKQGEEVKVKILREAEESVAKFKRQANKNIEYEFDKAKKELKFDLIAKSLMKAEELISANINFKDREKLADEYLKKVVA